MRGIILGLLLSVSSVFAADIVIDAEPMHNLSTDWDLVGKDLIVKKGTPYLRVDIRGNCHYEYEQECHPLPNGGMDCHTVPKWVCDTRSGLFKLPESIKTEGKNVKYQQDDANIQVGVMKSFLFWKWVKLEENIGIWTDIASAKLIIRDTTAVLKEKQFQELHK